MNWEDMESVK